MKKFFPLLLCLLLGGTALSGCQGASTSGKHMTNEDLANAFGELQSPVWQNSVFSWENAFLLPEREEDISFVMNTLNIGAIYQHIASDTDDKTILDFLARRHQQQHEVFYVTGESDWALPENQSKLMAAIDRVVRWNEQASDGSGFAGIVWDIEPHQLDNWEQDTAYLMRFYAANIVDAYDVATAKGLKIIVCIPIFFDREDLIDQLEYIVNEGSDAIAVMNYDKKDEAGQLETKVSLARLYNKGIIHITEMQPPGVYELTDQNTYYHDGVEAVLASWQHLKETFDYDQLGFSWHYLKPLIEILQDS